MKKQQEVVVVRKSNGGCWSFVKALLILAGIAFVAYKVYEKLTATQKAAALKDVDMEADEADVTAAAEEPAESEEFCAEAAAVIANPENME